MESMKPLVNECPFPCLWGWCGLAVFDDEEQTQIPLCCRWWDDEDGGTRQVKKNYADAAVGALVPSTADAANRDMPLLYISVSRQGRVVLQEPSLVSDSSLPKTAARILQAVGDEEQRKILKHGPSVLLLLLSSCSDLDAEIILVVVVCRSFFHLFFFLPLGAASPSTCW